MTADQAPGGPLESPLEAATYRGEEAAGKFGDLVPPPSGPGHAVLDDDARVIRWSGPAFALFSLIMLPWTVYLGYTLPSRQVSADYDVAWAGFDVLLLVGLAATAYFALRRSPYLAIAATATATLLAVDAWFDVVTSPAGRPRLEAVVLAVFVELPLAALCAWLSHHTHSLIERRIVLLLRDRTRSRTRRPGASL